VSRPEFLTTPPRDAYYTEAESWSAEIGRGLRASRRIAWIVASIAGGIAMLEAGALASLLPLKTTIPYVITVDRQTGYAELAQKLAPGGALTQQQAVIQSAIVQYVLARETFDAADLKEQYRRVQLWSDEAARQGYVQWMAKANPQSPLNLYPASTTLKVTVKGVTMLDANNALVRFDAERVDPAATSSQLQSFAATIGFRFSGEPMRMEDRFVNPLGFQVTHYRKDAEVTASVATPRPMGLAQ
jgi:type IV secretion system protein VirB8